MTRVLNGNLSTYLQDDVLRLALCWEITLTNGSAIYLTTHDKDLTFQGNTYISTSGFSISNLESGENLATDNAEIKVLLDDAQVNADDILAGRYNGARVKIYMVDWSDTDAYCALPGGFLTEMKDSDRGQGVFELVSLSTKMNQSTGRILIPTCDADVGDARCGVDLGPLTYSGTVTSVTSSTVFTDSADSEADDYYAFGKVTWTSGNNTGIVSEVRFSSGGEFTLLDPVPEAIQVGDGFDATPGCDRTHSTCINKFNNVINFRGSPFGVTTVDMLGGPT